MSLNPVTNLIAVDTPSGVVVTWEPPVDDSGIPVLVDGFLVGCFQIIAPQTYKPIFYEGVAPDSFEPMLFTLNLPGGTLYRFTVVGVLNNEVGEVIDTTVYVVDEGSNPAPGSVEAHYADVILNDGPKHYFKLDETNPEATGFVNYGTLAKPGLANDITYPSKNMAANIPTLLSAGKPLFGSSTNISQQLLSHDADYGQPTDSYYNNNFTASLEGSGTGWDNAKADTYILNKREKGFSVEFFANGDLPAREFITGGSLVSLGLRVKTKTSPLYGSKPLVSIITSPSANASYTLGYGDAGSAPIKYTDLKENNHIVFTVTAHSDQNPLCIISSYLNGELVGTVTAQNPAKSFWDLIDNYKDNGDNINISEQFKTAIAIDNHRNYTSDFIYLLMSHLSFWDYCLTAEQVLEHYRASLTPEGNNNGTGPDSQNGDVAAPIDGQEHHLGNNDWIVDIPPGPYGPDTVISVRDPENDILTQIPFPQGPWEADYLVWRKDGDYLYIIYRGKILWLYKLSAQQMATFPRSNGYVGFYDSNGNRIATPKNGLVARYILKDAKYLLDTTVAVEASKDSPFSYGESLEGMGLLITPEDVFFDLLLPTDFESEASLIVRGGTETSKEIIQVFAQRVYDAGYEDRIKVITSIPVPTPLSDYIDSDVQATANAILTKFTEPLYKYPSLAQLNNIKVYTHGNTIDIQKSIRSVTITGTNPNTDYVGKLIISLPVKEADPTIADSIDSDVEQTSMNIDLLIIGGNIPSQEDLNNSIVKTGSNLITVKINDRTINITGTNPAINYKKSAQLVVPVIDYDAIKRQKIIDSDNATYANIAYFINNVKTEGPYSLIDFDPLFSLSDGVVVYSSGLSNQTLSYTLGMIDFDYTQSRGIALPADGAEDPGNATLRNDVDATAFNLQIIWDSNPTMDWAGYDFTDWIIQSEGNEVSVTVQDEETLNIFGVRLSTSYTYSSVATKPEDTGSADPYSDLMDTVDNINNYIETTPDYTIEDLQFLIVQHSPNVTTIEGNDDFIYVTVIDQYGDLYNKTIMRDTPANAQKIEDIDNSLADTKVSLENYVSNNPSGPFDDETLQSYIVKYGTARVYIFNYDDTRELYVTANISGFPYNVGLSVFY